MNISIVVLKNLSIMLSFEKEFSSDKSLINWIIQGVIEIQQYSFIKLPKYVTQLPSIFHFLNLEMIFLRVKFNIEALVLQFLKGPCRSACLNCPKNNFLLAKRVS